MIARTRTRRAFGLIVVLVAMAMVAGLVAVLSMRMSSTLRLHRVERARSVAQALADSAAAYARVHRAEWVVRPPAQPIQLDVKQLLPDGFTGSAVLSFETATEGHICHIQTRAGQGKFEASDELRLVVDAATTMPSTTATTAPAR
jgi:type II secretory pathway pseudopilin PulG